MIKTPKQIIPKHTVEFDKPEWQCQIPRLYFFSDVSAITLDPVIWRDALGRIWIVPPGFQTDGATYPWPFSRIWDKFAPSMLQPAILHDMRYALHDYCSDWEEFGNRRDADSDFKEGMIKTKADYITLKYWGVRVGGDVLYEHESSDAMMHSWLKAVANGRLYSWIKAVIGNGKTI